MTLRELNQKISEKRTEHNNYRQLYWEASREIENLQKLKRNLELEALFEYLPIGTEYEFTNWISISGIDYRSGDRVIFLKKNPKSVVLK